MKRVNKRIRRMKDEKKISSEVGISYPLMMRFPRGLKMTFDTLKE